MKLSILIEWDRINGVDKLMTGLPEMTPEEESDQVERLMGKSRYDGSVYVEKEGYHTQSPLFSSGCKESERKALNHLKVNLLFALEQKMRNL